MSLGSRKHRCCPLVPPTYIALGMFFTALLFMAMLQLYPDSLQDYSPDCALNDLGFKIIPSVNVNSLSDIWVIISIVVFLILGIFVLEKPQLVMRRWLIVMAFMFTLRGIVVISTRYPRLPYQATDFRPSNPWAGALLILSGVRSTATDIMFSGHTVNWIITASFLSRYSYYGIFSHVFWVFNVLGILSLIAVREHYTADILVAVIISKLMFWTYHLFFDTWYKRFWIAGFTLETLREEDIKIKLPAKIVSQTGKSYQIDNVPGEYVTFITHDNHTAPTGVPLRLKFYLALKWLDYE